MTETEWQKCAGPRKMLKFLAGQASERKLRLFACACCRSVWHHYKDPWSPAAVELAERYTDGSVTVGRLNGAQRRIYRIASLKPRMPHGSPEVYAANAAKCATCAIPIDVPTAIETALLAACAMGELLPRRSQFADVARSSSPAEQKNQCRLVRCIFGNPFRKRAAITPAVRRWKKGAIAKLARIIHDRQRFQDLPQLADALEEAGCTAAEILDHCRGPGPHARGCWVVDLILGKE